MATACLIGLPALTSALTLARKASFVGDFFKGILFLLRSLCRLLEIFSSWRVFAADFIHAFARTRGNALAFGVNICIESRFCSHD